MTEQLRLNLREHDLPPMWDGHPVVWDGEWEATPDINICPPPKNPGCAHCGSLAQSLMRCGLRGPFRTATRNQYNQIVKRWTHDRLTALRCPDCLHDVVVDQEGSSWELGPEDYGPRGSYLQTKPDPNAEEPLSPPRKNWSVHAEGHGPRIVQVSNDENSPTSGM